MPSRVNRAPSILFQPRLATVLATVVAAAATLSMPLAAQQGRVFTAGDYDRAARLLGPNVTTLMTRNSIAVTWLPDDRFWYRMRTGPTSELVLVDPAKRTRVVCDATRSNCPGVPLNDSAAASGGGGRGGRGGGRGGAAFGNVVLS